MKVLYVQQNESTAGADASVKAQIHEATVLDLATASLAM